MRHIHAKNQKGKFFALAFVVAFSAIGLFASKSFALSATDDTKVNATICSDAVTAGPQIVFVAPANNANFPASTSSVVVTVNVSRASTVKFYSADELLSTKTVDPAIENQLQYTVQLAENGTYKFTVNAVLSDCPEIVAKKTLTITKGDTMPIPPDSGGTNTDNGTGGSNTPGAPSAGAKLLAVSVVDASKLTGAQNADYVRVSILAGVSAFLLLALFLLLAKRRRDEDEARTVKASVKTRAKSSRKR